MLYSRLRFRVTPLALAATTMLAVPALRAQQTLGAIVGTVTDATGSVLPNATVTVVGEETNLTRSGRSNSSGSYALPNLPIGTYTVTFTLDGFSSQRYPGIVVQADRTVTLPTTLKIGAISEEAVARIVQW